MLESRYFDKAMRMLGDYRTLIILGIAGLPIGIAVGAIDALFGRVLLFVGGVRDAHLMYALPLLPFGGALVVWAYRSFGKGTDRGMGLVFATGHGDEDDIPLRLVPLVAVGTWITHLCGGSAGREGVAVQIGATVSHAVGKLVPIGEKRGTFVIAGIAAGFAGLFRTPFAATAFALEVLTAGRLEYSALLPALVASFAASATSGALGLEKFTFDLSAFGAASAGLSPDWITGLLLLGLAAGLVGGMFARALAAAKRAASSLVPDGVARIFIIGMGLALVLFVVGGGRYCGLGTNLISYSLEGQVTPWDWLLKSILTVATLAAGFQGGEVTPLFSIGASLGASLAGFLGMPVELCAALGYAAVFGGATRTLLAPILIGGEVFGFSNLPLFIVVCCVARLFNMRSTIYGGQR